MRKSFPLFSLSCNAPAGAPPRSRAGSGILLVLLLSLIFLMPNGGDRAFADQVVLTNGDHLSGTVLRLEGGKATFKTEYAGSVEIKQESIQTIETSHPVTVRLKSGDTFQGTLSTPRPGWVTVAGQPGREPVTFSWSEVASINPPPPAWHGTFTLGGGQQSGNTDRANISIEFQASRKTERNRFRLSFLYNYAEENGSVTTRNAYGSFQYNYFYTSALFGYLGVELLNDHFKNLNLRTVVGPGAGYQIWEKPQSALEVEGGLAYFNEDVRDGEDRHWITARLAADFRYLLWSTVVFSDNVTIYPSLQQTGKYQLRNVAALTTPLWSNWSLNLKNIFERDSNPEAGVKPDDVSWILGLQYSF